MAEQGALGLNTAAKSTTVGSPFFNQASVMGILNVTPDSFSDGGQYDSVETALAQARRMMAEGANILDVGGESTRPGAAPVSAEEELKRVIPVIQAIRAESSISLSIDSMKPEVMHAACLAGATIINDVNALQAPGAIEVARAFQHTQVILMHSHGFPNTRGKDSADETILEEVVDFLSCRVSACLKAGIAAERIILDPGIGFGKTTQQNLLLLKRLNQLTALGFPLLLGLSRKSLIGECLGLPVTQRLGASVGLAAYAYLKGVRYFRVHDVAETARALAMISAVEGRHGDE